jgi:hypothetical protein
MREKYLFRLRFPKKATCKWAECYMVDEGLETIHDRISTVQSQGFYTKDDLQAFCRWKSQRTQSRVAQNPADYVEEITRVALSTANERLRIEILLLLRGVSWPTASVLLHFGHQERYPILDFRALWSLGIDQPGRYDFDLWWQYTEFCRKLADETHLSMREVDRALWKYSKENQRQ